MGGAEFEGVLFAEEILDLLLVFGGFEGTGGVNDATSVGEAGEGVLEDAVLGLGEFVDLLGGESPTGIDAASEDTGVGAGDVEKDGVEPSLPFGGGGLGPVEGGGGADADAEVGEVLAEAGEAFLVAVGTEEVSVVLHGRGDEGGLATGGGTGVEDCFAGAGGEEGDGVGGGGVLDVNVAAGEEGLRDAAFDFVEAGVVPDGRAGDFEVSGLEGIDAEEGGGGLVIPGHEGVGGVHAEFLAPAFVEPIGMGMAEGGGEFLEVLGEAFAGRDGAAQDGIDEAADGSPGAFHRFIDRGVIGDAEDEQLADADAEDVAGFVIEFAFAEEADPVIEQAAVSEDGEEDGIEEGAVGGGEVVPIGVAFDERFGVVVALGPGAEGGDGGAADVFALFWHDDWLVGVQDPTEAGSGRRAARPTE